MKISKTKRPVGFDFIQTGKYPQFIKDHPFFKQKDYPLDRKVFPHIGLANCLEECKFTNPDIALSGACLASEITNGITSNLYGREAKTRLLIEKLYAALVSSTYDKYVIMADDGRAELKLDKDVVVEGKVVYKAGKSLFKIYTAIHEMTKGSDPIPPLEALHHFKIFSNNNLPGSKVKIAFSSTGEDGLWDLATISMRGVVSCQAWDRAQSRALVSALSSRYTGVIYLTNDAPFNEYGTRMIRRALVRYCVHKVTKKPALITDTIYPNSDRASAEIIADFLTKKTGLPVSIPSHMRADFVDRGQYCIPYEHTWDKIPLASNEYHYMDSAISYKKEPLGKFAGHHYENIRRIDSQISRDMYAHLANEVLANRMKKTSDFFMQANIALGSLVHHSYYVPGIKNFKSQEDFDRGAIRDAIVNFHTFFKRSVQDSYLLYCKADSDFLNHITSYKAAYKAALYKEYKVLIK